MAEFLFAPVPHQEAIDFIKSKPIVSREVFDGLLPELRARAFVITGIEAPANVLQNVRDIIADLPAGFSWDKIKSQIVDTISPWLVDEAADAEAQAAQLAGAEAKAELLLRVHGQEAYQAAAYDVMTRQKKIFKYWQYQTMGDSKVRPAHAALEGLVLPADSPFWNTHFPPWDWGCRCIAIPTSDASLEYIAEKGTDAIVTGDRLHNLEHNNVIERFDKQTGTRKFIDVSPPVGPSAFKWDPGSLKLDLAQLKARYDSEVWSTFEKWAKKTNVTFDPIKKRQITVWDWLEEGANAKGAANIIIPPEISTTDDADKTDKET
jgi:SPP1 gp7 family putative phage head morphogenesis protein